MITNEKIYENKMKYLDLLGKLGIDLTDICKYLDAVDFFNKPMSSNSYYAYRGGLCEYSLKVCFALGDLSNAYFPGKYSKEDLIKVALFKDVYRAELYEAYAKNVKNEATNAWETEEAFRVVDPAKRPTFGDIGFSSYMIMKNFVSFTDEQALAICNSRNVNGPDSHEVMRSYQLVALTHMADCVASFISAEGE